jgi:hypothetical protein
MVLAPACLQSMLKQNRLPAGVASFLVHFEYK